MTKLTKYKLSKLTQFLPQLAQEIKTRVTLKSVFALLVAAITYQFTLVILALGKLPDITSQKYPTLSGQEQFSRYCTGAITNLKPPQQQLLCVQNLNHHWLINWQLFWFDIFTILSGVSIILLLVFGTYLIVDNLSREQHQGSLTLVTLAPQPAIGFFLGKIIGIPILIYGFLALSLPLHLIAGLQAGIPLALILAFYLATIASCAFFYNLGLFFVYQPAPGKNLATHSNRAVLITLAIACFLSLTACVNSHNHHENFGNIGDWLILFNPLNLVVYLGQITAIPFHYFNYDNFDFLFNIFSQPQPDQINIFQTTGLANIDIYGQSWQQSIGKGMGLVIANFLIGAYWLWQVIKRRFYNPEHSPISKEQSYWLSFQVAILALGLTLSSNDTTKLMNNFGWLQCFLVIFTLILIVSLSPDHYVLRDWLHNRQTDFHPQEDSWQPKQAANSAPDDRSQDSVWQDLVFGESSPANVAIALNLLIIACYVAPALIIFPIDNHPFSMGSKLVFLVSLIFLVATLWQWHNLKYHRTLFTHKSFLGLGVFIPVAIATKLTFISPGIIPIAIGIMVQWLAIMLITSNTIKILAANTKPRETSQIRGSQKQLN